MNIKVSRFNKKNTSIFTRDLTMYTLFLVPFMFFTLISFSGKYKSDLNNIVEKTYSIQNYQNMSDIQHYNNKYKGKINIEYNKDKKEFKIDFKDTEPYNVLPVFYNTKKEKNKIDYIVLNGKKLQVNGVKEMESVFSSPLLKTPEDFSKFLDENKKTNNELIVKSIN